MSTDQKSNKQRLIGQLSILTLIGLLTLLLLFFVTSFFGQTDEPTSRITREDLARVCQRPAWLDEGSTNGYDVEPISPTPVSSDSVSGDSVSGNSGNTPSNDDTQLSHVALYTRTQPYIEYDIAAAPLPEPYTLRWRMGIGIPEQNPLYFQWPQTRPGWYLNWTAGQKGKEQQSGLFQTTRMAKPDESQLGMSFTPMVRVPRGELRPPPEELLALAKANPGRTWLIGNEPDVEWQDNATPEQYAFAYRCAQAAIRGGDPTAKVAFAGLSQITPLRLQYLDRIWDFYQTFFGTEMEVDVWNMHTFVLREERDSWGVHIPPGMDDIDSGELWEIEDHNNIVLVAEQVERMRQWMHDHGQQNKPLIISEYGILLPNSYGFPLHEVVTFMWDTSDLFHQLRDPEVGYPEDDFRLVQRWVWFSTRYDLYPTGNLFNLDDSPGPLMRAMSAYIEQNSTEQTNADTE